MDDYYFFFFWGGGGGIKDPSPSKQNAAVFVLFLFLNAVNDVSKQLGVSDKILIWHCFKIA